MKEEHQVKEQLADAYRELKSLAKADYGTGAWRRLRGYIDALEWVLGMDDQ
jgi:hypothetical protein